MYRKSKQGLVKIGLLLKQERKLFHTQDLALLWGIENKNTLYTTIRRYLEKGILIPIQKGFYSTLPLSQIKPLELGVLFLHRYAYESTESILVKEGVINQSIPYLTLVAGLSKKFSVAGNSFLVRKLQEKFLYQTVGIMKEGDFLRASRERAVADLLYFNPFYHFDNQPLVDWKAVAVIQRKVGYKK